MIKNDRSEREIREALTTKDKGMTSVEFAHQLKVALVEDGTIKQNTPASKLKATPVNYAVTPKGRLVVGDFAEKVGAKPGATSTLEKPRGRSKAWRLVPA